MIGRVKGKIENWYTVAALEEGFHAIAPELRAVRVVGTFEGNDIITSKVVDAQGRFIVTSSGSVYELGTPDPDYLAQLANIGWAFDPARPIKVH